MQNIDFSRQIRPSGLTRKAGADPAPADGGAPNKTRNRLLSLALAGVVLIFAIGFYSGVRLGELRQVEAEDCVIQNPRGGAAGAAANDNANSGTDNIAASPDTNSTESGSGGITLSNTSGGTSDAAFIIKVGTFKPQTASKMADRLNTLTRLSQLKVKSCKGVQENVPGRGVAFRMKAPGAENLENVLVGCFTNDSLARNTLEIIRRSGLPGATRAELYEY